MSNENKETVTITQKEYKRLKKKALWLSCLENAGVDNWDGYDYAQEILEERGGYDDEDDDDGE